MILAVLFANVEGNILIERFSGVPAEERLHWRSFLVKLGADNLKGVKNEELLVASHKSVYIVYTVLGDVSIFVVGKDEYDELASVKDVCGKPPTERVFLDKYGKICLCLDEIVWKELQVRVANLGSDEEKLQVQKDILSFHGEMVLLLHYTVLNFTGLIKIVKKHNKRTGTNFQFSSLPRVMRQPFFSTDLLYKLMKECEAMLASLYFSSDNDS